MTYQEYKISRQKEADNLPIFYVFNNNQLKEEMEKRGLIHLTLLKNLWRILILRKMLFIMKWEIMNTISIIIKEIGMFVLALENVFLMNKKHIVIT